MSKRAEEKALEKYPVDICGYRCGCAIGDSPEPLDYNQERRNCYQEGYEQVEEDTIERAIAWLKEHANDYIVDLTPTYPDAPVNIVVGGKCWDDLKEYLEEEK